MDRPATFWMLEPIRKYATFTGRARRAEYWWYALLTLLLGMVFGIVDFAVFGAGSGPLGLGTIGGLLNLALICPSLAVGVRRLHDRDKSGWWLLLLFLPLIGAIVLLVWFCSRGTVGQNQYGPDPLDPAGDVAEVFS